MHSYLRAIGFSDLKDGRELRDLMHDIYQEYDEREVAREEGNRAFMELSKSFGTDIGITVCGILDKEGFHQEYYFPYLRGSGVTTKEDLMIEKRGQNESFTGACEDIRVGVSLIFYLQNAARYKKESIQERLLNKNISTTFAGLSLSGKVILPVCKDDHLVQKDREITKKRNHLISEAREGNEEAIESLTLEDIDMYSMISRRIQKEDVFTIVESYFMPYGTECDQYHILGEIKNVQKIVNDYTGEKLYQLNIECNDMNFDVCINTKDLIGDPEEGRRFKGTVWLQGHVNFEEN